MPTAGTDGGTYPRSVGVLGGLRHCEPLLRRLLHALPGGVQVCAYFINPEALPADLHAAVVFAASPADLAARSQLIFVMPDDIGSVEATLHGPTGLQAGVHSPTTVVISSIVASGNLRDVARLLHDRTAGLIRVVDAPVLGPAEVVATGRYPLIVGATPTVYRSVQPVLELVGPCTRIGGIGAAQIAKACEQFVLTATSLAAIEAMAIAQRAGVDLRTVPGWSAGTTEEDRRARQIWAAPFESAAGPSAAIRRAAMEVVSSEADRGPATVALLARVGELLTALMDDGLEAGDLYTAGSVLIAVEQRGTEDLESDPTLRC